MPRDKQIVPPMSTSASTLFNSGNTLPYAQLKVCKIFSLCSFLCQIIVLLEWHSRGLLKADALAREYLVKCLRQSATLTEMPWSLG